MARAGPPPPPPPLLGQQGWASRGPHSAGVTSRRTGSSAAVSDGVRRS